MKGTAMHLGNCKRFAVMFVSSALVMVITFQGMTINNMQNELTTTKQEFHDCREVIRKKVETEREAIREERRICEEWKNKLDENLDRQFQRKSKKEL